MKKYEVMYIVNASLDDEQFASLEKKLYAPIIANGGTIDQVDNWGVKDFAYEIDHMKKGHYVVMYCTADNAGIEEFQRLCRITNSVIRVMVIKKEEEK